MPPPQDKKGVETSACMLKYVAKFIPDMSSIIQPIRELVKKEVHFIWEWEQEVAFKKIKEKLSVAPALTFFNVKKPTTISCDAITVGVWERFSCRTIDRNRQGDPEDQELTESDNTLQKLKSIIRSGIDLSEDVQSYWNFRNELSEAEGIILKGEKIVIPTSLRKDMLTRIHRGHLGIVNAFSDETVDTDIWDDPVPVEPSQVIQPDPIPVMQAEQEDQPLEMGQPVQPDPALPVVQAEQADQPLELGPPVPPDSPTADINTNNNLPTSPQVEERPTPPPRTARGRLVKNPLRYTDFVES
eukprot:Em0351g3a